MENSISLRGNFLKYKIYFGRHLNNYTYRIIAKGSRASKKCNTILNYTYLHYFFYLPSYKRNYIQLNKLDKETLRLTVINKRFSCKSMAYTLVSISIKLVSILKLICLKNKHISQFFPSFPFLHISSVKNSHS